MKHHLNLTTVNLFYPLHEPSYVRTCILHVKVNPGVILHQWTIHNKTSSHILSVSYMNRQQGILLQLGKLHFSQSSCFDLLPVVSNYVYLFYTLSLVALLTWFWVTQTQLCAPQCACTTCTILITLLIMHCPFVNFLPWVKEFLFVEAYDNCSKITPLILREQFSKQSIILFKSWFVSFIT